MPAVTFPYCSLCSRWAALMSAKLYVLISWPDGSRVINIENIKEPRKPFHLYTVGEQVLARCPGFSGLYWGVVEGISEHKDILEKKLLEDRHLLEKLNYVALPMKRKSDGILSPCQQHICLNSREERKIDALQETDGFERVHKNFSSGEMERVEKMEQLERMVLDLQQDVLSLKKKVQRLESLSFQEEPHRQPCEVVELFNGYTKEQLKETIRFDQKISTACKTLLYKLFTSDYIQSHSITGRRGNTFREAKPMMDERCIKIIRVLLKQKFGDHLSDTVITEKIQNVQKALRQKFKTECL
ncbi:uncharacterized protein LOC104687669 isoform X4 [Corvus cornix cornix]|uniref:uncharacterized protein LOC108446690 isoform X4 n=1 Tax=Corvus brachyrhynchos TaxID=85066 RepID=UPI0008163AAA|nr:PREDICTED: uncharacterized protein LOC108446690 isoform X4 [Corvus brachyrhynchos]XP_019140033.1 uncharacterized protein LOC104687669 isoform X4 [Corvus cornix cornix]